MHRHPNTSLLSPLLLVVVVVVCCANGCLASDLRRCLFDELRRKSGAQPLAVVREVPRKGQSGWQAYTLSGGEKTWAPIRIKAFTEDMNNQSQYCNQSGVWRPNFRGDTAPCTRDDVLTAEKRAVIVKHTIPLAVELHSSRLLVQREDNNIVVPKFNSVVCASFTVPEAHYTTGVSGADMIMYVAAGPAAGTNVAWAESCASLKDGRPVVGVINFASQSIAVTRFTIRITAHELAHALGFNYEQMKAHKMLSSVTGVRGKPLVTVVSSRKTKQMTQLHYNCSTTPGMELEDEDSDETSGSHWERRNAKDELMTGMSGAGYYTALTMAAFEDMQFFKANWGMEEHMGWGHNTGCKFLNEKCLKNNITDYPNMFCNESTGAVLYCTFDQRALGRCTLTSHKMNVPQSYRYFAESNLGGNGIDLMDYCPIIAAYENSRCSDGEQELLPGSRVSPNSRCVKGDSLRVFATDIGDVCVDVRCDNDVVSVRYLGDDAWYACPEGSYITPRRTFSSGRIVCPKYIQMCRSDSSASTAFVMPFLSLIITTFLLSIT
ncbi:surface protease GP63 [Trypanosoma grayi]|uniref:surface protease GP63 n=1 Tax=Trypanosoma grayi TaxID=71804 RepID=UPI0004F424EA|nr:surface protease GP63 [Trypanosoma grayi]KEG08395.1 surface protease GP63 [Trypanosoma grayi]